MTSKQNDELKSYDKHELQRLANIISRDENIGNNQAINMAKLILSEGYRRNGAK